MPFVQAKQTNRIFPPDTLPGVTSGDWVEISCVSTSALRRKTMGRATAVAANTKNPKDAGITFDSFEYRQALLEEIIVGWSDSADLTPENIGEIHPLVQDWIAEQFNEAVAGRPEDEKKASSSDSEPTTASEEALSPVSSGI